MATKKKAGIALMPDAGLQWDKAVFTPNSAEQAPAEQVAPSGIGGFAADVGRSVLKGMVAIPEAAVGLVDIATGGRAGQRLENIGFRPGAAKQILDQAMTPEHQAAQRAVHDSDGIIGTALSVAKNPSVLLHAVLESLPLMGAGGVVARGALALAPKIGMPIAAGLGEGVTAMGSAAEQIRQQTPGGHLTGMQSAIAVGSGALTGALGVLGGKIAQKFGIADVDVMLAGKGNQEVTKGFVRRVIEGAVSEGLLEELPQSAQEQIAQNMALGKPLDEGLDQAIVLGTLAGGIMGAGANAFAKTPAGDIRSGKLPGAGPLTTAVNAGIEGQAQAIENKTPPAAVTAQSAGGNTAPIDPTSFVPFVPPEVVPEVVPTTAGRAPNRSDPAAVAQREADKPPEPTAPMVEGDIGTKSGVPFSSMRNAMRALEQAGGEATHELARVVGGLVVRPKKQEVVDAAQPDADGVLEAVDGARGLGAEQLRDSEPDGVEQSPTGLGSEGAARDVADELRPNKNTASTDALTQPDDELPMGQGPGGESRVVKVGDRDYTLTPEQRTELEAVESDFKTKFDAAQARYERTKDQPLPDDPDVGFRSPKDELAKTRKGLGFQLSAERRRIVGALTPKEQSATAAADSRVRAGDVVETPDGQGTVAGVAFGKVRVAINGATTAYKRADIEKVRGIDTSEERVQETEENEQVATAPDQGAQAPVGPGASRATPDAEAANPTTNAATPEPQPGVDAETAAVPAIAAPAEARRSPRQRRANKATAPADVAAPASQEPKAEPPKPDNVQQRMNDARQLGREASKRGEQRAPPQDLTGDEKQVWRAGWDQAKQTGRPTPQVPPLSSAASTAPATAPSPAPAPAANTIFTEDAAAAARARLKAKLGRAQSGIDPETMMDGITLAGYHIEKGARTFAAYARAMVDDLGDAVKPYLQSWYMAVRADPRAGEFRAGMDKASAVEDLDIDTVLAATQPTVQAEDAPSAEPPPPAPVDILGMTTDQTAALEGTTVEIEVAVGDTGQTAVLKMDAADAVRDVQTRLAAAEELLGCLK